VSLKTKGCCVTKITGLDELTRKLQEAQQALEDFDGNIAELKFDPFDPVSIDHAIQELNRSVDERLGSFYGNPIVDDVADKFKEAAREEILQRAAAARIDNEEN